jgi:hypothetical protein
MVHRGLASETEILVKITELANKIEGFKSYCIRAFGEA